METYFKAIDFAQQAHWGQYRKGDQSPYLIHPLSVMQILIQANCKPDVVIAGCLHDTLEDTKVTIDDIKKEFGIRVADLVIAVSEPDKGLTWKERKIHTIEDMKATTDKDILYISSADKIHNLRCSLEDFEKNGEATWTKFRAEKSEQAWYYRSLTDVFLSYDNKHPLFIETAKLTKKLFTD